MKVMADDAVVYDRAFPKVTRDNNTAGVFETVDFSAAPEDLLTLKVIGMAKQNTIRLSGNEKRRDFELSSSAKARLNATLDAYTALLKVPPAKI